MIVHHTTIQHELEKWGLLTCGGILQGSAMAIFLFPHNIPSGGAAGLAVLINYWLPLPMGLSLWIVNFFLMAFAIHWFGYIWTFRTMFSVTVTSVTISLIQSYLHLPQIHLLVDILCGSLLFGIGVGILIKNGASSGGLVIPALALSKFRNIPPGKAMFWLNLSIFTLDATIIDAKIAGFAILCQWISTKIIDYINKPHIE